MTNVLLYMYINSSNMAVNLICKAFYFDRLFWSTKPNSNLNVLKKLFIQALINFFSLTWQTSRNICACMSMFWVTLFSFSEFATMISLSDAVRLESSNPAVNTLKPWWEVWIDYTLNAFLLVVLFALAGVTISGTPGLVCLPTNTNLTSLNYAANFYANAKCTTHVDGHILVVFPYIIFAQWAILFTLHLSWFHLPSVKAFLASSFDTFQILKKEGNPAIQAKKKSNKHLEKRETSTKPNNRSNSLPNSQDDGDDDDLLKLGRNARLVYLVDLLQYMSQFRYNLVNLYTMKSIATCVLTALLSAGLISWLVAFRWRTTFTCDLQGSLPPPFDHNSCSFPAAPYVYSIMILNIIFTIFLGMFNLRALFWLAKFRYDMKIGKGWG